MLPFWILALTQLLGSRGLHVQYSVQLHHPPQCTNPTTKTNKLISCPCNKFLKNAHNKRTKAFHNLRHCCRWAHAQMQRAGTWTSNRSEVALTGRKRERGTFTPMAWSKNCNNKLYHLVMQDDTWTNLMHQGRKVTKRHADQLSDDDKSQKRILVHTFKCRSQKQKVLTRIAAPAAVSSCSIFTPSTSYKRSTNIER